MKQKSALLLLLFLLLAALASPAQAIANDRPSEDAEMLLRVQQSVVRLYAVGYDPDGSAVARWTGTGFAVGIDGEETDIFLTNRHVALGDGEAYSRIRLWLLPKDAELDGILPPAGAVECMVLSTTDAYPDIAVIRALDPVPGCRALPLLSSLRVPCGTEVYALGYSGLDSDGELCITSGHITVRLTLAQVGNTPALVHDAFVGPGRSGGPLIDRQGRVIGINTYGFDENTERFCAIHSDCGMALLDGLGIAYTAAAGPSRIVVLAAELLEMPELPPMAVYAGLAAWVLILLAVILLSKRNRNTERRLS